MCRSCAVETVFQKKVGGKFTGRIERSMPKKSPLAKKVCSKLPFSYIVNPEEMSPYEKMRCNNYISFI